MANNEEVFFILMISFQWFFRKGQRVRRIYSQIYLEIFQN